MSTQTPSLALSYLLPDQAQKHVTVNEALGALDDLVQARILSATLLAPPASPAEGDAYIPAATATGQWAGHENDVAVFRDGAWNFHAPNPGWQVWSLADNSILLFTNNQWQPLAASIDALQNMTLLGLGTGADAQNPLAAKLNNALFSAQTVSEGGTGDLRLTLNKEAASGVLSLLFQSAFSGYAEIGLLGDNDLSFKTSADGITLDEAMRIRRSDQNVLFSAGLHTSQINGGQIGGFRNHLINGAAQIWQRGTGPLTHATGYQQDRWLAISTTGWSATISQVSDIPPVPGILNASSLTVSSIGAGDFGLRQYVENANTRLAGPVIFKAWVKGPAGATAAFSINTGAVTHNFDGNWQELAPLTATLSGTGNAYVDLFREPSLPGAYLFTAAQLESGDVASAFENRPETVEMLLCQRYFQRKRVHDRGYFSGAITASTTIALQPPMRTTPTASTVSAAALTKIASTSTNPTSPDSVLFTATTDGSSGQYEVLDQIVDMDAELSG